MADLERGKSSSSSLTCRTNSHKYTLADPQHSTAKRQQRSQAFTSHMTHASLERQLLSAQAAKTELENKLRQKEVYIEQLEGDRRFLSEREKAEREEKEKEREANGEDKVRARWTCASARFGLLGDPHAVS